MKFMTGCAYDFYVDGEKREVRNQIWHGIWELGGVEFYCFYGYRFLICLSLCCLMCIKGGGEEKRH